MAMLIAWVLFLVPQVELVTALRDSHAVAYETAVRSRLTSSYNPIKVAYEKRPSCLKKCCSSKCSNQSQRLVGDLSGQRIKFEDCKVKVNKPRKTGSITLCEETCQVTFSNSNKTKPVPVLRHSAGGPQECWMDRNEEICQEDCCVAKCSGQSYSLKAKWKGTWQFQNCTLPRKQSEYVGGYGSVCLEVCTLLHSKEPQEAVVFRRVNHAQQCGLVAEYFSLQELAMDFVEKLETSALKLTSGNYKQLPLMKAGKVAEFLKKVKDEIIQPEVDQQRFSREITTEIAVVIGDLHGQLFNLISYLLKIKEEYKDAGFTTLDGSSLLFCDPGISYVFMGDYVNRGERGVELLLLLLAYKARCPQGMVLLQGNHETRGMWKKYGFAKELRWKFGPYLDPKKIEEVVELLPYVAVSPGQFMALHGGLSPELERACTGKDRRFRECVTKEVGRSTVWPDPHDGNGYINSTRDGESGGIKKFGMDVAEAFLKSNNLKAMFRGHEQVEEGLEVRQKGDSIVVTIFSAADYVGLFCPHDRKPPWDPERFPDEGLGNSGAIVMVNRMHGLHGSMEWEKLDPDESRDKAAGFTGARCESGISLLQSESASTVSKAAFEGFIEENHKRIKRLGDGNFDSCSLEKDEIDSVKAEARQILGRSKNQEFEARKLIDLQGEALTHGDDLEICKTMKKDKLILEVYDELDGTDEEIVENDIETRERDVEETYADE